MPPFDPTNKAPGVYIEEVPVPGPIAGVGTSTAAFIGPALAGPINEPVFITNWTQFVENFGDAEGNSYITSPPFYLAHAVRGFLDNGGTTAYIVRVGTAVRASLPLNDRATPTARRTLVVTAKQEGITAIKVEVQNASIVAAVAAVRAQATLANASNNQATVTAAGDASNFRPGDIVFLEQDGTSERATIASISGTTITFQKNLTSSYTAGTIRIADLEPGERTIRIEDSTGIEPGTYIRITKGATTESGVIQSVERTNNFITLTQGLTNTYRMTTGADPVNLQTLEFTLIITTPDTVPDVTPDDIGPKSFENLSMDPRHSRYFAKLVDSSSVDVTLHDPPSSTAPPKNLPAVIAATVLTGGQDDDLTALNSTHFTSGIDALERVDEVNILCLPDRTDQGVQSHMILHCQKMQDRFAILDAQPNAAPGNGIVTQRSLVSSERGYAALYYPWVFIANPLGAGRVKVPPSGHVAGVYARTDGSKGVHKAPANEALRGVLALERTLTDDEQGPLNEQGINVLRTFLGLGPMVWGARTIVPQDVTQWRYINVRRLLLFIEESIQEGTRFAVFEPNNLELWQKVKRQVTEFLTRVWRDGALFGATPDQAFRVKVDEELNPPSVRALGQLVIEVVVYPVTPAEFIVFRVIQKPGGPSVEE